MNFTDFREQLVSGNASVNELVQKFISKIDSLNPKINAYTSVTKDIAKIQAEKLDELIFQPEFLLYPLLLKCMR